MFDAPKSSCVCAPSECAACTCPSVWSSSRLSSSSRSVRDRAVRSVRSIRHRGPDYGGLVVIDDRHVVAHERLAIVDPRSGAQPFVYARGTPYQVVCAVNGEIYNHEILRNRILARDRFQFQTRSDCEVIVPMYLNATLGCGGFPTARVPGADAPVFDTHAFDHDAFVKNVASFIGELDGMFAFVLHDRARGIYVAARDHLGIIPLYVGTARDGSTCFSSEMKALVVDGLCADISIFPPGHFYVSSDGDGAVTGGGGGGGDLNPECAAADVRPRGTRRHRTYRAWYNPPWHPYPRRGTSELVVSSLAGAAPGAVVLPSVVADLVQLRTLLEQSVRQCMGTVDAPWGVLLSGGLDSSLVAAIATRAKRARAAELGYPCSPISSFTIGLRGSPDVAAAEQVAAFLKTRHFSYTFTVEEGLDALRDVVYHLETYDVTSIRAGTPMFLMSRQIRAQGVKMVLSGEGADEIFGGYLYFHRAPSREEFWAETVDKLRALHLYDCNRANKSTAAWGVEARVPFLDRAFVDYAMSFDPGNKMINRDFGFIEKFVLRAAFNDPADPYLPPEILWRQKEQFSDGVGYAWIDALRANAAAQVSDAALVAAATRFPHNPPQSKEAYVYREMFEEHFPPGARCEHTVPGGFTIACSTARVAAWDASFRARTDGGDPSGRAVRGVHQADADVYADATTTTTSGHDTNSGGASGAN